MPGSFSLGGIILRLRSMPSPRLTCLVMTPLGLALPSWLLPSWESLSLLVSPGIRTALGTPNNTDPDMPKKRQNSPLRPRVTSLEKGPGGLMKERISGGCSPPDLTIAQCHRWSKQAQTGSRHYPMGGFLVWAPPTSGAFYSTWRSRSAAMQPSDIAY